MKTPLQTRIVLACLLLAIATPGLLLAALKGETINVTLWGQPCLLSGPYDKAALKTIHSISPEQIYPDDLATTSVEALRQGLGKLRAGSSVPSALDNYRERMSGRVEAQLAFAEGLAASKKTLKAEPLLAATRKYLKDPRAKEFETLAKKIELTKKVDPELVAQLQKNFGPMLEPDPEDDFHRAIRKLNVIYTCEFSEEGETETE